MVPWRRGHPATEPASLIELDTGFFTTPDHRASIARRAHDGENEPLHSANTQLTVSTMMGLTAAQDWGVTGPGFLDSLQTAAASEEPAPGASRSLSVHSLSLRAHHHQRIRIAGKPLRQALHVAA